MLETLWISDRLCSTMIPVGRTLAELSNFARLMSSMQLLGFDSKSAYSLAHGAVDEGGGWLLVW